MSATSRTSSAERVILPDSTILADYLLAKTATLIEKLLVYPTRMLKNLESTGGPDLSGQLLLDLAESGMLREDAYRLVQGHAMRSWKEVAGLSRRDREGDGDHEPLECREAGPGVRLHAATGQRGCDLRARSRLARRSTCLFCNTYCFQSPVDNPQRLECMSERLIQIVDAAMADAALRSGGHLVCRPGCSQCCVGVFPIAQEDADRLHRACWRSSRPIQHAPSAYTSARPSVDASGSLVSRRCGNGNSRRILRRSRSLRGVREQRALPRSRPHNRDLRSLCSAPVLCRTFGPPMRTEEDNLATCELCYIHASTEEIAACELDPGIPRWRRRATQPLRSASAVMARPWSPMRSRVLPPIRSDARSNYGNSG